MLLCGTQLESIKEASCCTEMIRYRECFSIKSILFTQNQYAIKIFAPVKLDLRLQISYVDETLFTEIKTLKKLPKEVT